MSPDERFQRDHWPADDRLTPARADLAAACLADTVRADRYATATACRVTAGQVALRAEPKGDRLTELLFGEPFAVYETRDGWAWGQSLADGYVGYLRADALADRGPPPTHRVAGSFTHLYPEPRVRATAGRTLPFSARLRVTGAAAGAFLPTADGYVPARHLIGVDATVADPLTVARRFLGAPYLWGGRTMAGLDCSALVQLALEACGRMVPRDTDLQAAYFAGIGAAVTEQDMRIGDLVYFPGHVAFIEGDGTVLHATGTWMDCRIEPYADLLARVHADHADPITGIFRPPLPDPVDANAPA